MGNDANDEVFAKAILRFNEALMADQMNRDLAYSDLDFLSGNQWDDATKRGYLADGRPMMTIDLLSKFCKQVSNEIKRAKPGVKVMGVDNASDPDTAAVLEGLIRHIETTSDAQLAYGKMADSVVACGMGHVRVVTEYYDDVSDDQVIKIMPVRNQLGVIWDPNAVLPTRADAMYCFEPVDISLEAFQEEYPGCSPDPMPSTQNLFGWGGWNWWPDNRIVISRYWLRREKRSTEDDTDAGDSDDDETPKEAARQARKRKRAKKKYEVVCYTMSGSEIIKGPEKWAGQYIPIIPCVGEEIALERNTIRKGLIRDAKDSQRLFNFSRTNMVETFSLQPKAPFIATANMVKANRDVWETANKRNLSVLVFTPDPQMPGAKPERVQPPMLSQGVLAMAQSANEDIKAVTGLFDASLGQKSNETSGRAILAREKQGDTATYHFTENVSQSIARVGKVVLDLIPHIYDTRRMIRIVGQDGFDKLVSINGGKPYRNKAGKEVNIKLFEAAGQYDVVLDSGPTLATQRDEIREMLMAFVQSAPNAAPMLLPVIAKLMNIPDADELEERLTMLLPPEIRQELEARKSRNDPERQEGQGQQVGPDGQPIVPPAEQAAMAAQQMAQQQAAMAQQQQEAQIAEAAAKLDLERKKAAGDMEAKAAQVEVQHATASASILSSIAQMRIAMAQTPAANVDNDLIGLVQIVEQMMGIAPLPVDAAPIADPNPPVVPDMPPDDGSVPPQANGGMPPDVPPMPMEGAGGPTLQ